MTSSYHLTPVEVQDYYAHILQSLPHGVTLTSSAAGRTNIMTISWGTIGIEWNKLIFTVFVRTGRYTHQLLQSQPTFTINLPLTGTAPQPLLTHAGTISGRTEDKVSTLGLTLVESPHVAAPGIAQLPLTLECRILYQQTQVRSSLPSHLADRFYPSHVGSESPGSNADMHTAFSAEIVGAYCISPS